MTCECSWFKIKSVSSYQIVKIVLTFFQSNYLYWDSDSISRVATIHEWLCQSQNEHLLTVSLLVSFISLWTRPMFSNENYLLMIWKHRYTFILLSRLFKIEHCSFWSYLILCWGLSGLWCLGSTSVEYRVNREQRLSVQGQIGTTDIQVIR